MGSATLPIKLILSDPERITVLRQGAEEDGRSIEDVDKGRRQGKEKRIKERDED
jgi:hypothetical protein